MKKIIITATQEIEFYVETEVTDEQYEILKELDGDDATYFHNREACEILEELIDPRDGSSNHEFHEVDITEDKSK